MTSRRIAALIASLAIASPGLAQVDRAAEAPEIPAEWLDQSSGQVREVQDEARARIQGKAPPTLETLSGWMQTEARSWEDLRGKVVLLDVWATWCGPCVAGIPHLREMQDRYSKEGLVILGVHSSRGYEKMEAFVAKEELPWAFAADADRAFSTELGIRYIPSYFLIDRAGTLRVAYANRERLDEIVEALLDEPAPATLASWPEPVQKKLYASDVRGQPAPAFEVEQWLTPQPSTEGKVMLIDFWATWCPPCRALIPELNELQERFHEDLVVIGVSDEPVETVRGFLKDKEIKYSHAIDTKKRMNTAVGVQGIPHVLIVSTDGVVRWQGFPGSPEEPLTPAIIEQIINADPGVAARRATHASAAGG
ncbi:MAG: TlpA family protein disulfide reductase [Phycisphaeraceae bacterium]|nr:TlpA family protein disulfide reductase [Phycisphaeraceae bacterium]